ncbi:MAG: hypothetical protein KA368_18580 [Acidobacteria bacterium]|nr:hypothetical protein [Acidobacteriota bacterium]
MRFNSKSIVVMFACLLLLATAAAGQSGRKQKKAEPQPAVQGVNQPETRTVPEPEVVPDKPKEKQLEKGKAIMVSSAMGDMQIPMYYTSAVSDGCLDQLRRELKTVQLSSERNQTRGEAMKTAKESEDLYVVWIELQYDRMGAGSMNGVDVRFTVFEPKTGKQIAFGTGYPRQPNGVGLPPLGGSREQMYLDWSGRDIADQVIKRLGLRSGF